MFTIRGVDGKEYGPVTPSQIKEWMHGGRAKLQTPCRRGDETAWKSVADFPEFNPVVAIPPVIPSFAEATPAPSPLVDSTGIDFLSDPKSIAEAVLAKSTPIDVFGCLSRSFDLWKTHFPTLVGATFVIVLIQLIIGIIPILGGVAGLFLNGVFYGGLYYFYLGKIRGENRELTDVFAGFSRCFGPLAIASVLRSLLLLLIMLPFFAPLFAYLVEMARNGSAQFPEFTPSMILGIALGSIPVIYLAVAWAFTFMLVIDKNLAPWQAMEVSRRVVTRHWFHVFFVALFGGILGMLGLIGFFVGVIFTMPLLFGALLYAYEDLFNPPQSG